MIYKKICFKRNLFEIDLAFSERISVLVGDSGSGKTFLYKALDDYRMATGSPIILLNNRTYKFHETLRDINDCLVVIDHAEQLLTYEDKMFINQHKNCQYLIIGRNFEGLFINPLNLLSIDKQGNKIKFRRYDDLSLD